MFEGINSLLSTLNKFNAIDAQCQTLSEEMQALLPELTDNAMAIQFAKDSVVELNNKMSAMREGLGAVEKKVSPIVEEFEATPEPEFEEIIEEPESTVTIEPDFELSPEEDEALAETEKAFAESVEEEDDESGIIIEEVTGEIFPEAESPEPFFEEEDMAEDEVESPIPEFDEERQGDPLDRVEDWDELYQAKVEDLISAGAQKEARALKEQCLEIRSVMYDENGDIIHMPTESSGMSKETQAVWRAARKEVVRMKTEESIASQTPEQTAVIDEMLDDLDIINPTTESEVDEVEELLEGLEAPEEEPTEDFDEDLDALLDSIK